MYTVRLVGEMVDKVSRETVQYAFPKV